MVTLGAVGSVHPIRAPPLPCRPAPKVLPLNLSRRPPGPPAAHLALAVVVAVLLRILASRWDVAEGRLRRNGGRTGLAPQRVRGDLLLIFVVVGHARAPRAPVAVSLRPARGKPSPWLPAAGCPASARLSPGNRGPAKPGWAQGWGEPEAGYSHAPPPPAQPPLLTSTPVFTWLCVCVPSYSC